jgi:hypothetical protein
MRARAVTLTVLLLAALVSGCGSEKNHDGYVQALNRAQNGLTDRFGALQSRVTPTSSPQQDARTLRAYEAAVGATVADLRKVRPPTGFDALHRRFVAQIAGYGTALRTARGRLGGNDPQGILAAQGRLRAAVAQTGTRLNATIQAINQKLKG